MDKRLFSSSLILCLLVLLNLDVGAQSPDSRSLKGLKSVGVVIVAINLEIERAGITASQVRQSVERQLRNAGVHVYDYSPLILSPLVLHIKVSTVKVKDSLYAASIEVDYKQPVMLVRDKFTVGAITWSKEKLEVVESNDVVKISSGIEEIVEAFIKDYLAENPKAAKTD